jgi:hypothetical protein
MSIEGKKQARVDKFLRPGQIVDGRYRVDHLIAEGGMAAVWAGHNIRVGKRLTRVSSSTSGTRRQTRSSLLTCLGKGEAEQEETVVVVSLLGYPVHADSCAFGAIAEASR